MQPTFPLLSTVIFLPLVGILVLLLVPGRRTSLLRWTAPVQDRSFPNSP